MNSNTLNCASCIFMAQGENGSYCANEEQENEAYQSFVNWSFHCELYSGKWSDDFEPIREDEE